MGLKSLFLLRVKTSLVFAASQFATSSCLVFTSSKDFAHFRDSFCTSSRISLFWHRVYLQLGLSSFSNLVCLQHRLISLWHYVINIMQLVLTLCFELGWDLSWFWGDCTLCLSLDYFCTENENLHDFALFKLENAKPLCQWAENVKKSLGGGGFNEVTILKPFYWGVLSWKGGTRAGLVTLSIFWLKSNYLWKKQLNFKILIR